MNGHTSYRTVSDADRLALQIAEVAYELAKAQYEQHGAPSLGWLARYDGVEQMIETLRTAMIEECDRWDER